MRFDYLAVGPKDDPATIRFHPRLTVVSGMGSAERDEMFELLLGALTGRSGEVSQVHYVDATGRSIRMVHDGGVHFFAEDGTEAPSPLTTFGLDVGGLRRLMLIEAADVGVVPAGLLDAEHPELQEARATLAALEAELADALSMQAKVEALRAEVTSIDERLHQAEEGGAKRRYARLLAELERVRVEAASLRGGATVAEADRRFIVAASDVQRLAGRWREVEARAVAERERFGGRERLDARTLAEALDTPDQVPPELDALAAIYEAAEAQRALLAQRLHTLATDHLAEPSHPAVIRLAHADQDLVWGTARQAIEAEQRLEGMSVALGGLEAEGVAPTALGELEQAHDAVDRAERVVDQRFLPGTLSMAFGVVLALAGVVSTPILSLLGTIVIIAAGLWSVGLPRRALAAARVEEQGALDRAGVPSYMGLQLRRLEVTMNPSATEPLELAALEYRRAMAAWRELAGDLSVTDALAIEAETRAYAASVSNLRGAADQIAEIRHELVNDAEPAVERARRRLLAACAPFGIEDASLAVELVRHQVGTSTHARLQQELERAEAAAEEARQHLEARLTEFGFTGGDMAARVDAFDRARAEAQRREQARTEARPAEVVEAELTRLEAVARAEHRPEWGSDIIPDDGAEPDAEELRRHRQAAMAEFTDAKRTVPDVERLTDRRDAMQRRVAVLEEQFGGLIAPIDTIDLQQLLSARLAAARRVGPTSETVPLVLNEPFESVHGDRKWTILDELERLSSSVQLTYLTDDVDTIVWARRRAAAGAISLLEPVAEPAL